MDGLAQAAEHADRAMPLKMYCTGLLLPGERKSVEPMAARLAPENVRRMHQSLHHMVADAPWSDHEARDYEHVALLKSIESPVKLRTVALRPARHFLENLLRSRLLERGDLRSDALAIRGYTRIAVFHADIMHVY